MRGSCRLGSRTLAGRKVGEQSLLKTTSPRSQEGEQEEPAWAYQRQIASGPLLWGAEWLGAQRALFTWAVGGLGRLGRSTHRLWQGKFQPHASKQTPYSRSSAVALNLGVHKYLTSVSLKSDTLEHPNMVWEVKTNQMPNAVQKLLLVVDKRTSGMNDSLELLKCNENLPSSPGYASCDEHMELGK